MSICQISKRATFPFVFLTLILSSFWVTAAERSLLTEACIRHSSMLISGAELSKLIEHCEDGDIDAAMHHAGMLRKTKSQPKHHHAQICLSEITHILQDEPKDYLVELCYNGRMDEAIDLAIEQTVN